MDGHASADSRKEKQMKENVLQVLWTAEIVILGCLLAAVLEIALPDPKVAVPVLLILSIAGFLILLVLTIGGKNASST